jgi:cation transport ATPase
MENPSEDFRTRAHTTGQNGHTNGRSMLDLFSQLVDQMSLLFRKELELAKAEMSEKASQVGSGMVRMMIGAVLMIPALVILLQGLVAWMDHWGLQARWSFIVVGIVAALIGYALLHTGMNAAKPSSLAPRRTAHQLQRDAAVAKEQVR